MQSRRRTGGCAAAASAAAVFSERRVWMIVFIVAAAALLTLAVLFAVYRMAFYAPPDKRMDIHDLPGGSQYRKHREVTLRLIDELAARPYERITVRAHDGVTLVGRYYHFADGAPLDIGFHGYRGHAYRDFCGGSRISFAMGHNLLLVDQRGQGESGGRAMTFGVLERQDAMVWLRWAQERLGRVPTTLYGVSMGGATVLMSTELPLPAHVRAVIADCPYSDPVEIICHVGRRMHLPPVLTRPLAIAAARLFGGFDLRAASALTALEKAQIPVLLIHGEDDRFVPCEMSRRMAQVNPEKVRLCTFPGAGHGLSYMEDTARYERIVQAFLDEVGITTPQ